MGGPEPKLFNATPASTPVDADRAALRKAGWSRGDQAWERLQEQGIARHLAGDMAAAEKLWRRAWWVALWRFSWRDMRWATTLANLALADRLAGREGRAMRRYARARRIWAGADRFVATMRIARRAPSPLFPTAMEGSHWDTYTQNTRIRLTVFTRAAATALAALEQGRPVASRLQGRWPAEKPAVFDDTRRLLAAALLVAVPLGA